MQSKVDLIESLQSVADFELENLPSLRAAENAPKILCRWPRSKESRNQSSWIPMDKRYILNLRQARACFSLVLCTTPPWMADFAVDKSAKN